MATGLRSSSNVILPIFGIGQIFDILKIDRNTDVLKQLLYIFSEGSAKLCALSFSR